MTALVFNCQYNGLSIIQELGRRGVQVLALDTARSVGTYSRYAKFRQCPDPMIAEQDFIQYLLGIGPLFDTKPVLFPTNDHWSMAISRHKEALLEHYIPCVADWSAVEMLIRKRHFYDWAVTKGYPVSRCWPAEEFNFIPDDAFPIAAKPEHRRVSSNEQSTKRILQQMDHLRLTVLRSRSQLDEFILAHDNLLEHFLFVEYVEGLSDRMYTVGVYANREHEVIGMFTGRKVRGFPPDIGDCIVGQVEEVPQRLKDMVRQMCREMSYHGIAEFEFKQDAVTGEFNLIEINPRSWSWVGITPACGVSLPWIAYADLTGIESVVYTESQMPTGSVKWIRVFEDLPNCLFRNRRAGYPEWHMTLRQWWQSLQSDHLVVAELTADDLLPGLFSLYVQVRAAFRKVLG